ncbi:MAG: LysM peptidoglycan-binding domain-containing protein [Tepidisphaeraceae bacterium]
MTRETKIGLLVGLAFIIVVGILLSEHLTSATERPAAQLAEAGHNLRAGVSAPGTPGMDDAAPLRAAEPQQPIPTARDLTPIAPVAPARVAITNPAPVATPQSIIVHDEQPAAPAAPQAPVATNDAPIITKLPAAPAPTDPFANDPVVKVAAQHGEAVVPVTAVSKPAIKTLAQTTTTTTGAREYKAQAGDTLSRMAALLPGGSTKANRDAIVKLNPTLQKDPNKVISGHTYLLPTDKPSDKPEVAAAKTPAKAPAAKPAAPQPSLAERTYVVKPGDTLSKIAQSELGSKNQVGALKKLNDDVLKGSDVIKVDMKLKLPAKALASAS